MQKILEIVEKRNIPIFIELHVSSTCIDILNLVTKDAYKIDTIYSNINLPLRNGENYISIKLPIHPKHILILFNTKYDCITNISYKISKLDTFLDLIKLNNKIKEFLSFCIFFSENKSILPCSTYYSDSGNFRIDYVEEIRNSNTPARINCHSNIIEVNKSVVNYMTVQQMILILLHEYSHCHENKDEENEFEADFNAIKYYFAMNMSENEAQKGFAKMFINRPTLQNKNRYQFLKRMIYEFKK